MDRTEGWIRVQEEHIWTTMVQITKDLRVPLCAGLAIVFCLLDTLPSFPANLAYQSTSPIITGFTPKAYAQRPWLGFHSLDLAHTLPPDSHRKAEDILKEAILCSTGGNAATTVSIGPSASTAPKQTGRDADELPREGFPSTSSLTVRSPTKCKCARSPSPHRSWSGSSSSGRGSASDHRSRGSHSSSLGSGSSSGSSSRSHDRSPARSEARAHEGSVHSQTASDGSVKVLSGDEASGGEDDVLDSANKADVSQGSMSLPDISTGDDEDTRKRKACKLAPKSDTEFAAWRDKLIHDGAMGIQKWDSMVNGYADAGKRRPKIPDTIEPPVSYMKEHGVFQPLPSMTNPLGLCCFYPADPSSLSTLLPLKPPATKDHLKSFLVLVKAWCWPYIIVVFQGGPITPLGLSQELHSCHALARIPIFLPDETKDRHRPWVSCCPFCAYTVQNDPAYLNHIIGMHYHTSLTCGACLNAIATLGQQLKRHLSECSGLATFPKESSQESACSEHSPKKSAHGSSSSKSKHGGSQNKKSHHSRKSQLADMTSQEDSQTGIRHLTHVAGMSQESTTESSKCHSGGKKKAKKMHKKSSK